MLISKAKPCMSKFKWPIKVKPRTAHYNSYYILDLDILRG